jgi:hypothetical protein
VDAYNVMLLGFGVQGFRGAVFRFDSHASVCSDASSTATATRHSHLNRGKSVRTLLEVTPVQVEEFLGEAPEFLKKQHWFSASAA